MSNYVIPKDVLNIIINHASVTEVHRLTINSKEVGFFKSREEAFAIALKILSNYYICNCYRSGRLESGAKLPSEISDTYKTIPTSSEEMLAAIESLVCKINKNATEIIRVKVENKDIF
jgi:hypothetical protein